MGLDQCKVHCPFGNHQFNNIFRISSIRKLWLSTYLIESKEILLSVITAAVRGQFSSMFLDSSVSRSLAIVNCSARLLEHLLSRLYFSFL